MINLVIIAILAWGIHKCVVIAERPHTNPKGAYSLGIILAALILCTMAQWFSMSNDSAGKFVLLPSDYTFLMGAAAVGFIIASVGAVFALLGLREIEKSRTAETFAPTPGRGMAIAALGLWTALFAAPFVVGFVAVIMQSARA